MRQPSSTFVSPRPFAFRPLPASGAIEWEELPSLAGSLAARLVTLGTRRPGDRGPAVAGSAWDPTAPAPLAATPPPKPFREPLAGCAVREVDEPDVFRHFFGD